MAVLRFTRFSGSMLVVWYAVFLLATPVCIHSLLRSPGGKRSHVLRAQPLPQEWHLLKRSELQDAAKQYGVRGNMKSVDIIAALDALSITASETDQPAEAADSLQDILAEQGITWDDLISLQAQYSSGGTVDARPTRKEVNHVLKVIAPAAVTTKSSTAREGPTRIEVLKAPVSASRVATADRPKSTTGVIHRGVTLSSRNVAPFEDSTSTVSGMYDAFDADRRSSQLTPPPPTAAKEQRVPTTGVTLEAMLTFLVENRGFPALYAETKLKCFEHRPTLASSLKVLRLGKVEWARRKIEHLYVTRKRAAAES